MAKHRSSTGETVTCRYVGQPHKLRHEGSCLEPRPVMPPVYSPRHRKTEAEVFIDRMAALEKERQQEDWWD